MAYGTPVNPVGGTVITVAYAVSNILDPIRWLRLMTGNADPPASSYVVVSSSTAATAWSKVPADALATGVAVANLGYTPVNRGGDTMLAPLNFGDTSTRVVRFGNAISLQSLNDRAILSGAFPVMAQNAAWNGSQWVHIATGSPAALVVIESGVLRLYTAPAGGDPLALTLAGSYLLSLDGAPGTIGPSQIELNAVGATQLSPGAGAVGQLLGMAGVGVLGWVTPSTLSVQNAVNATNAGHATTADSATNATSAGSVGGKVPTATAGPNALPLADSAGKLDAWVTPAAFSIPSGLGCWVRQASEIPAGFARETSMDGVMAVGAGTTFGQTFNETQSYGSSWAHGHGLSAVPVSVTAVTVTGTAVGGAEDNTGGPSATNGLATPGGENLPTATHSHSLSGVTFAVSASGTGSGTATGSTQNQTWLPPMRAIVWVRKS